MPTQIVPTETGTVDMSSLTTTSTTTPTVTPTTTAEPSTTEELTTTLDGFQNALYGDSTEIPSTVPSVSELLGGTQWGVPEDLVGFTPKTFTQKYGGDVGTLARAIGMGENDAFTEGQILDLQKVEGWNPEGSGELNLLNQHFSKDVQTGGAAKPPVISLTAGYEFLADSYGLNDLNNGLNYLKAEQAELEALWRETQTWEEGKPVPMGVIAGRLTEQQKISRDNLEFNMRQQNFLINQINSANQIISMYMNYAQLDYQNAVTAYNTEFDQNLAIANFTHNVEMENKEFEFKVEQWETTQAQASLTTFANAITAGNLNYNDLSADQKLAINNLETQAGLPPGTISNLGMSPSDKILGFSSDKSQAIIMGADGNMTTVSTGITPSGGGSTKTATTQANINDFLAKEGKSFVELVKAYANSLSLAELYDYYDASPLGIANGHPTEDSKDMAILYADSKAEIEVEEDDEL